MGEVQDASSNTFVRKLTQALKNDKLKDLRVFGLDIDLDSNEGNKTADYAYLDAVRLHCPHLHTLEGLNPLLYVLIILAIFAIFANFLPFLRFEDCRLIASSSNINEYSSLSWNKLTSMEIISLLNGIIRNYLQGFIPYPHDNDFLDDINALVIITIHSYN